jgi:diadenosine tetraphosphate (Ap4A) HIT family hydrolase
VARHGRGRRAARGAADADLRRGGERLKRRPPPDLEDYRAAAARRCFICDLARGEPQHPHHVVYDDERALAFLNRFPTVLGQTIVAPREHREQVTGDFSEEEYVELQRVVRRVGEALRRAVPTERLYVLSLGSQAANSHVHWHVVPLPPGVSFEQQQLAALDWSQGVLDVGEEQQAALAGRIRAALPK